MSRMLIINSDALASVLEGDDRFISIYSIGLSLVRKGHDSSTMRVHRLIDCRSAKAIREILSLDKKTTEVYVDDLVWGRSQPYDFLLIVPTDRRPNDTTQCTLIAFRSFPQIQPHNEVSEYFLKEFGHEQISIFDAARAGKCITGIESVMSMHFPARLDVTVKELSSVRSHINDVHDLLERCRLKAVTEQPQKYAEGLAKKIQSLRS